ncbi:nitroreductase family protein [Acuticoccus sediminis]|uniref:Nitroreductase family protein n=1 Tax=Acuticoccus sediminis TaxID=2184697 RepID=A0A8B2NQV2_9HYPH|nr:nitroreductase family protein [Acuticoccus sediminis]RAH97379.1 nitroreductase family protein [Acuticoccus sediminis]
MTTATQTRANMRTADHPVSPLFLQRWSPRAFTDETIGEGELLTILEAARWAPSSYNLQPWRFVWARRGTEHWARFLDLLMPFNRVWAQSAAALVFVVSDSLMKGQDGEARVSHSHSYDSGAAAASFMLQATSMGWQAHGMLGIELDRIRQDLAVPEHFRVEAAYAIGRQGDKSLLPEKLAARETPSDRKPLAELAFEGGFPDRMES